MDRTWRSRTVQHRIGLLVVASIALASCAGSSSSGSSAPPTTAGSTGGASSSAGGAAACVDAPPDLVRWWTFDAGDATERAQSTPMTPESGALTAIAGQVDGGATVSGSSFVGDPPAIGTGDLSVVAWVRTSSPDSGIFLDTRSKFFATGWYFGLYEGRPVLNLRPGGDPNFFEAPNNYGTESVADGQWHLIAGVADRAGGETLFVDGSEDVSGSPGDYPGVDLTGGPLTLGAENSGDDAPAVRAKENFAGDLDEVMVFARALDAAEIAAIDDAGPLGVCKP